MFYKLFKLFIFYIFNFYVNNLYKSNCFDLLLKYLTLCIYIYDIVYIVYIMRFIIAFLR